jgi:hypothetical protein
MLIKTLEQETAIGKSESHSPSLLQIAIITKDSREHFIVNAVFPWPKSTTKFPLPPILQNIFVISISWVGLGLSWIGLGLDCRGRSGRRTNQRKKRREEKKKKKKKKK